VDVEARITSVEASSLQRSACADRTRAGWPGRLCERRASQRRAGQSAAPAADRREGMMFGGRSGRRTAPSQPPARREKRRAPGAKRRAPHSEPRPPCPRPVRSNDSATIRNRLTPALRDTPRRRQDAAAPRQGSRAPASARGSSRGRGPRPSRRASCRARPSAP